MIIFRLKSHEIKFKGKYHWMGYWLSNSAYLCQKTKNTLIKYKELTL